MLEKFQNLNISEVIIRALNEMGFEEPTPIQSESIPVAMSGVDMIGQAQTGTGKTAAYGIPVLEKILKAEPSKEIQTVVLSPTRELAMQVAEELNHLAQFTNIQPCRSTAVKIWNASCAACARARRSSSPPRAASSTT